MKMILALLLALVAVSVAQFDGFFSSGGRGFSAGSGPNPNGPDSPGPIVFPPAPESPETSGVVIGASGYGFVPPGSQGIGRGVGRSSGKSFGSSGKPFPTYKYF